MSPRAKPAGMKVCLCGVPNGLPIRATAYASARLLPDREKRSQHGTLVFCLRRGLSRRCSETILVWDRYRIAGMGHTHDSRAARELGISACVRTVALGMARSLSVTPITGYQRPPATVRLLGPGSSARLRLDPVRSANALLRPPTFALGTTVGQTSGAPAAGTWLQLPKAAPEATLAGGSWP